MLTANESLAIAELKTNIALNFPIKKMILFGSKARGDDDVWSDVDLLILLDQPVDWSVEKKIIHIAHDIEIASDVVFGLIVLEESKWRSNPGQYSLRQVIDREGIAA